jgi:hypothetical protein
MRSVLVWPKHESLKVGHPIGMTIGFPIDDRILPRGGVTGFTRNLLGITTCKINIFTYASAVVGAFFAMAGVLVRTRRNRAAMMAVALRGADIVGRIGLVVTGLYPAVSIKNTLAIAVGTLTVAISRYTSWGAGDRSGKCPSLLLCRCDVDTTFSRRYCRPGERLATDRTREVDW